MKRTTREWLERVVCDAADASDFETADAADILDGYACQRAKLKKQAAEIRDLKARVLVMSNHITLDCVNMCVGSREAECDCAEGEAYRAGVLANKNWSKP